MAKPFDPYHCWLGIPPEEQPPHLYRLLGIEPLEDDPDVIESAADQRMGHLRSYQGGPHALSSQKLLNEVAAAKVCLLNPQKKAVYDQQLRRQLHVEQQPVAWCQPVRTPQQVDSEPGQLLELSHKGSDFVKAHEARGKRQAELAVKVGVVVAGLVGIAIIVLRANPLGTESTLVLDWPESERHDGRVEIDDESFDVPPTGPVAYPLVPGKHHLVARRPGFYPFAHHFALPEKGKLLVQPQWRKLSNRPQPTPRDLTKLAKTAESAQSQETTEPKGEPTPKPPPSEPENPDPPVPDPVPPPPQPPSLAGLLEKQPVPPAEEQEKHHRRVEDTFKLSKPREPSEQRALAEELLGLADQSTQPAERFVLLQTAADLAGQAGEAKEMLRIAGVIGQEYEIDRPAFQLEYLERFTREAKDSERIGALVGACDEAIDEAIEAEKYQLASKLADVAYKAGQRPVGQKYRKQTFDRHKQVEAVVRAWKRIQAMLERIERNPEDTEANLAIARWYCFERDQWAKGLPYLARCGDGKLEALARQELESRPTGTEAMVKLGDGWWGLAEMRKGREREVLLLRAGAWYRQARPDLAGGLAAKKLDMRLAEIVELGKPIPAVRQGHPVPQIPRSWDVPTESISGQNDGPKQPGDPQGNQAVEDTLIAEDAHAGFAGLPHTTSANVYQLQAPQPVPLRGTFLRWRINAGPARDSAGNVFLSLDGRTRTAVVGKWSPPILMALETNGGWAVVPLSAVDSSVRASRIWIRFEYAAGKERLSIHEVDWHYTPAAAKNKRR